MNWTRIYRWIWERDTYCWLWVEQKKTNSNLDNLDFVHCSIRFVHNTSHDYWLIRLCYQVWICLMHYKKTIHRQKNISRFSFFIFRHEKHEKKKLQKAMDNFLTTKIKVLLLHILNFKSRTSWNTWLHLAVQNDVTPIDKLNPNNNNDSFNIWSR